MLRRPTIHLLVAIFVVTIVSFGRSSPALASPVATDDTTYAAYGRVFPDPHGCVKGLPGKSPFAKGNVCATTFLTYPEAIAGLRFLETKFPEFLALVEVGESAGIPTPTLERKKSKLYAVRVTDERVGGAKKKFAIALSIHGIERAGAEGGTRAIEDLVTWGRHEPQRGLLDETLGAGASAVTVARVLAESEIWFFYPNPDGWVRGDPQPGGAVMFQRYNGNGVDPNRDWVTKGYTYRPYTPGSEPEVKAFSSFLKAQAPGFAGTADLHGMLDAHAFTYTMLPAGEFDYARNRAIVAASRRIQEDSVPRLGWFVGVTENGSGSVPDVAQQWGTVWDTIAYTTTGSLGDWMGTPLGLDAYVPLNNEMWVSHLAPNTAFIADLEQAHIDGNKGLIYAQLEGAFRDAGRTFPLEGAKVAYVDHGRRFTNTGTPATTNPYAGLPPQSDITADVVSPTTDGTTEPTYEFDVLGPDDGVYNGGLVANITYTNTQGISVADLVTSVYVERYTKDDEGDPYWQTLNYHWNQAQLYASAGMTVAVNSGIPGRYRVRFDTAPPGVHRVHIDFSGEQAWPDPGQLPYDVTSTKFFEDLARYLPAGTTITRLTPDEILAGADLSAFDTVILVNDPLPGWYDATATGGTAQPGQTFSVVAPAPNAGTTARTDATYEFDVLPEFDNRSMTVAIRWSAPSDYDLYVERRTSSGAWVGVGSSTNGINTGETAHVSGFFPGRYRARVNNWAGAAQPIDGTITFSTTPGHLPMQYPVTRTRAQAESYYASLKAFAESGGNLLLTDGAARALAYLGVGTPKDVQPVVVYAPYIEFNNSGTPTYGDPLAANVDQPGAAEGPSNRHQTVEPVPLGYAIQDAAGGNASSSFTWAVRRSAWAAANGRIAGTISDEVALGEVAAGSGRIRFVGSLLPDPEERFDHPFGLSSYALTYTGWQLFENAVQWHRPLPDLAIGGSDVALSTQKIVGGDQVTITATVRNIGTAATKDVAVRFTDNGTQIGSVQTIAQIAAGGSGTASVVWDTKHIKGDRTITVTADPANAIRESNETNNSTTGTVTVRGNKVQNASFEESASGTSPDHWSSSGSTSYPQGSDGQRSVTAGAAGSWTSDAITVEAGKAYGLTVDMTGGGSLRVEQLSTLGAVLSTLSDVTTFTAGANVTQVRVVLLGGLTGTATFDNVRMWEE
ncbi:MAG TPA: CARDB domain-containing protein [Candidatus Limnocylindria bacterium]|nr:CARDB domain-containing protein [Candidatus Limnocylindria bacterium]